MKDLIKRKHNGRLTVFSIIFMLVFSLPVAWADSFQPLPSDQVYHLTVKVDHLQHRLQLHWDIAPEYYLYKDRTDIKTWHYNKHHMRTAEALLAPINWPQAKTHNIPLLGTYHVFEKAVTVFVPVVAHVPEKFHMEVFFQGCAKRGFCYPPMRQSFVINWQQYKLYLLQWHKVYGINVI